MELELLNSSKEELLNGSEEFEKKLQAIFSKHGIRPHESLATRSTRVLDFLKKAVDGQPALRKTKVAIKFARNLRVTTIGELLDDAGLLFADPILVLPSSFGGLHDGMLAHDNIAPIGDEESPSFSLDVADKTGIRIEKRYAVANSSRD